MDFLKVVRPELTTYRAYKSGTLTEGRNISIAVDGEVAADKNVPAGKSWAIEIVVRVVESDL